jgi:hypothetical protein
MTIAEMQDAICLKLEGKMYLSYTSWTCELPEYRWIHDTAHSHPISWPTEGLFVCHEAEKTITDPFLRRQYYQTLDSVTGDQWNSVVATWDQRLEALCRVWYPERFN